MAHGVRYFFRQTSGMGFNANHLIQATYRARTFAYYFAALILTSRLLYVAILPQDLILIVSLLVYPHLVYLVAVHRYNSATAARNSMLIDAVVVACMVVATAFASLPAVAFVSGLVMSTLMIARPAHLLFVGIVFLLSLIPWLSQLDLSNHSMQWPLTDYLSAFFIVSYGALVAALGFTETSDLEFQKRVTRADKIQLENVYQRLKPYVPPQLASSLESQGQLYTKRRQLTVFFSDIEGFTSLMDNLPEQAMTKVLNEYLNEMANIAIAFGGTVDKFIGDGVMILFGAPDTKGARFDAIMCARMAIAMRIKLEDLRQQWSRQGLCSSLHIRIGIHSGYCAVGNFGSGQRMDYTAVGGVVNIASRLEGAAGRNEILVSGVTWALIKDSVVGEQRPAIKVKGIMARVPVVVINQQTQMNQPKPKTARLVATIGSVKAVGGNKLQ